MGACTPSLLTRPSALYNHRPYMWHPICTRAVAAQHNDHAKSRLSGPTPGTLYRRATTNWCMTSITRGAKACRLCPMSDRKKCSACVQQVHRGRHDRINIRTRTGRPGCRGRWRQMAAGMGCDDISTSRLERTP